MSRESAFVDRLRDDPVMWFVQLTNAIKTQEFDRAEAAKRELMRLGWEVKCRMFPVADRAK